MNVQNRPRLSTSEVARVPTLTTPFGTPESIGVFGTGGAKGTFTLSSSLGANEFANKSEIAFFLFREARDSTGKSSLGRLLHSQLCLVPDVDFRSKASCPRPCRSALSLSLATHGRIFFFSFFDSLDRRFHRSLRRLCRAHVGLSQGIGCWAAFKHAGRVYTFFAVRLRAESPKLRSLVKGSSSSRGIENERYLARPRVC